MRSLELALRGYTRGPQQTQNWQNSRNPGSLLCDRVRVGLEPEKTEQIKLTLLKMRLILTTNLVVLPKVPDLNDQQGYTEDCIYETGLRKTRQTHE